MYQECTSAKQQVRKRNLINFDQKYERHKPNISELLRSMSEPNDYPYTWYHMSQEYILGKKQTSQSTLSMSTNGSDVGISGSS